LEHEPDPALGNGGLGRLAACFLDSMASLGIAGYGYGINYEFGLFKQEIDNGYQLEQPDGWNPDYSPWLIARPDEACLIPLYGRVEDSTDRSGQYNPMWLDWRAIVGVPHDLPIVGFGGHTVNFLRLYSARASDHFDIHLFNAGDYIKAVDEKIASETISKVLYPSDSIAVGRELRLQQEYFFVACAIRDIVHRYLKHHEDFDAFPKKVAIQLNDTHPALAVAELMRILVDEHDLDWDDAWRTTQATCAYTNHTLMPEALERWPVEMLGRVLPRHLQIIYEINRRFLIEATQTTPHDDDRIRRLSLIEENGERQLLMANLAIVGSHSVNGVSELHSELVRTRLVPDFARDVARTIQ
jgi:starch phosphorylase